MNNRVVSCDKCNQEFQIKPKTFKKKGIEETYFNCPECKEKYGVIVTDKTIRRKQKAIKELQIKIDKQKDPEIKKRLFSQFQKDKKEIETLVLFLKEKFRKNKG
ncbi:hypothetical protein [Thalassobacillus sp. C254]|uniref:hypothetical protein n=1 Tax=Thalassobacillus sp. C254 TaxID=1225341 RepID=UPI0006D1172D|nr:hypothetical protein [Thalassobacillus sp. C254]